MQSITCRAIELKKLTQSFLAGRARGLGVEFGLWPEAEDRAMRGRNLSAAFRTLYRQVGQSVKRLPSCAQTWRVENECDKSTPRTCQARTYNHTTHLKKTFPSNSQPTTTQTAQACVRFFRASPLSVWDAERSSLYFVRNRIICSFIVWRRFLLVLKSSSQSKR